MNHQKSAPSAFAQLSGAKRRLLSEYLSKNLQGTSTQQASRGQPVPGRAVSMARGRGYARLRELSLCDYPQAAALEARYGLGVQSYDQWSHVWLKNPAYLEYRQNWPIGWVLENESKQIVGSHRNIPLRYELGGKRIIAACGRGMVVEPDYRGYSLWLLTALFEQDTADLCLDTTANPQTSQDDAAVGALRVPVGAWDRHVFWITNYRGALSIWLMRQMPKRLARLAGYLCYPFTAALFLRDALAISALKSSLGELLIESPTTFDERFDRFWEDLRRENPHVLLAVRTREVLQWHFAYALLQNRLWIWTATRDSRMVAYAIFLKELDPRGYRVNRVSIVDFQALGRNATALLPMVSAVLERCRRERVHVLDNVGLSFDKSGINGLAPYRRNIAWAYYYKARDNQLADRLRNPSAWDPSLYDGDASIS